MSVTGSTAVRRHVGCRTDDRSLRRPTPPGGGTRRGAGARAAVCGSGFFERQSDEPLLPSGVHEEEDGLAFLVARVFDALDDLGGTVHGTLLHRYDHVRSDAHTYELQSLLRISYAVSWLENKKSKAEMRI